MTRPRYEWCPSCGHEWSAHERPTGCTVDMEFSLTHECGCTHVSTTEAGTDAV